MEFFNFFVFYEDPGFCQNTVQTRFFRYFMTVIDHDFKADRKIDQLDMSKWKR